ncbi:beta-galactosidase [Kutzneria kofuensis]|uniref:beta-galactosidase n=1 Tax=Kutzneria kofuensis TaxID=103725 RepID=A0A7W9KRW9_9PSEU|nr:beta-galactosidase [Kutzneria kofuensis]MBB5896854.1 beta-galactosidase GanA [Kutzneria kofuensis]
MRSLAVALALLMSVGLCAAPVAAEPTARHQIGFDRYSLTLDGRRQVIWSGEFHPYRLPSPDLWLDVLQKMKATGYNAVSIYFDWGYHSPAPGVYDFTGVRDMDRVLDLAARVGLYVIARPGPYINAEVTGGGFPGWLSTQAGRARGDAPDYLAAADEWLTRIDRIIARHQYTDGHGSVILYQIENELAATGTSQQNYVAHLYDKVRADGIAVPVFHNDKGRNGIWVPASSGVSGTVPGKVDLYAFDGYPGGACHTDATPGSPNVAPDWGLYGPGGAKGGASASPNTPGFAAEFGGGWFDYWGSNGTYPCTAVREGPGYERVFYGTNLANGLTIQNFYMTFGGTSWGWLPAPVVYTSYDYGAAIDEARQLRPKALTMKEMGYFLATVPQLSTMDRAAAVTPSSSAVKVYHNTNPGTGTQLYVPMHSPSNATTNDTFTFPLSTTDGSYTVPQSGVLRLNGQDAKLLVADLDLAGQHLVYSTSELMAAVDGTVLMHGRPGEDGETVLRYAKKPRVDVLAGDVTTTWSGNDLRLNYRHDGLARVRISGGGRPDVTLLLADDATADTFWRVDSNAGPLLVRGPDLVRTAKTWLGGTTLTGDTKRPTDLEVWGARGLLLSWNGGFVPTTRTRSGSLQAVKQLPGPVDPRLPALSGWRTAPGSPEAAPGYDDSKWTVADKTTTNSTTKPPAGQPVLTADDYGFSTGDVWYRGHYQGVMPEQLSLQYGGGGAGMLQAWLDGQYLGENVLPSGLASPPTTGTATFSVPAGLRADGPHVLSVMVRNDGHNEDGGVNDAHKEGRGLISVALSGASWRIQGGSPDPVRGPLNNGGLAGERDGWHLPGFPDREWTPATLPAATADPGTTWYRTTFDLRIPAGQDTSVGLTIGDPGKPRSGGHYRALIFVNGWNLGQYIADVGPQHTFALPTGILDPHGHNTLAIAVTSDGGAGNGLENVTLSDLGSARGGVPVRLVTSPGYRTN